MKITKGNLIIFPYMLLLLASSFRFVEASVILGALSILSIFIFTKFPIKVINLFLVISVFFIIHINFGYYHFEQGGDEFLRKVIVFFFTGQAMFLFGASELKFESKRNLIMMFNFFSCIYCYYICYSSFSIGYRGYAQLYDPINNIDTNSPLIALMLILNTIIFIDLYRESDFRFKSIVIFLFFLLGVLVSGFYLDSRASLVLAFFYVIFILIKIKIKIKYLLCMTLFLFTSILFFVILNENLIELSNLDLGGFSERGLNSPRFEMLLYGINNFIYYPFGGMKVVSSTYDGIWFHNMLLDIVRVSGWVTMILWLSISIFFFVNLVRKKKSHYAGMLGILYLALLQDLAFDGFYNLMMLVFFFFGCSLTYNNSEKGNG